jgi:preprotein translocase subunit YajC
MNDIIQIGLASMAPPGGQNQVLPTLVMFAAMFAIFYFLLIRPQQKQKQERARMLAAIKKGDRVVTSGGLHATVVGLNEHTVTLRIADQVKVEFDRAAIGRVVEVQGEPGVRGRRNGPETKDA